MHNTKLFACLIALLCLGCISQNTWAQTNTLARIYFIDVKDGHGADFEAALKKHADWRTQQQDPWNWDVHQVVNGANLGDFLIRSGEHTWADFDAYNDFLQKGAVHFNETVGPHIASIRSSMSEVDTTMTRWPDSDPGFNLFSITTYHLKPGHGQQFSEAVKTVHETIMEHDYPVFYAFIWQVNGGMGPTATLALPYTNWAAMEGPEQSLGALMAEAHGQEKAQEVFDQFNSSYTVVETMVLALRRDLSVRSAMQGSQ